MAKTPEQVMLAQSQRIDAAIKEFRRKKKARLQQIADKLVKEIQKRTRAGEDGEGERFPSHSKSYIDTRRRYKKNLSKHTSVTKSNLTATGQLVDAIYSYLTADGRIIFDVLDKKRGRELSGGKGRLTNQALAAILETKGRLFLNLTNEQEDQFVKEIGDEIAQFINDQLGL